MTPAESLDKILAVWQQNLPPKFSPQFVANFIAKHRAQMLVVVGEALAARRAKRGLRPRTDLEWAAYEPLVERSRALASLADDKLFKAIEDRYRKLPARDNLDADEARDIAIVSAVLMYTHVLLQHQEAVLMLLRRPVVGVLQRGRLVALYLNVGMPLHSIAALPTDLLNEWKAAGEQVDDLNPGMQQGGSRKRWAMSLWARTRAGAEEKKPPPRQPDVLPPDLRDKSWRTEANLAAMQLAVSKDPGDFSAKELLTLAQYSGWGGLSIEAVAGKVPPTLVPETFGLIHEYYTPTIVAEAVANLLCPLLPELAGNDGVIHALEPSAGIGRLIRAFSPKHCLALEANGQISRLKWTAVEFSKVSSRLLRALRPDVTLHHMPFERFVRELGSTVAGTLGLVVANPPYGERGAMAREDPSPAYNEKRAFAYFMRRALDLLVPGGVGVFLVPAGLLSGVLNQPLREKLLRRHHLLAAYRLPSHNASGRENVPGAAVVMDVVIWRSRGGELGEIDEADRGIAEGKYFQQNPGNLLGTEDGSFAGDDEAGKSRSWRYKVTGDLPTRFPTLTLRPVCTTCTLMPLAPEESKGFQSVVQGADALPDDVDGELRLGLELGVRTGRYLAAVAAEDARAPALWPELHASLTSFAATFGNPYRSAELAALVRKGLPAAQQLLNAYDKAGNVAPALRTPPKVASRFSGPPNDVVAQADTLFRQQRTLTVDQLLGVHKQEGGTRSRPEALALLFAADWNLDGNELYPFDAYVTGNELWARYDRAQLLAAQGDEQARTQARRLIDAIQPARFEDLGDIDPRHGYVPLGLLGQWLTETLNSKYGRIELERAGGFVQFAGHNYVDDKQPTVSPEVLSFLGYYNHDPELFQPPKEKREKGEAPRSKEEKAASKQNLAERRIALAKKWADSFAAWVSQEPARREELVYAYNRVARGRVVPTYTSEPLEIARWGAGSPQLRAHQVAGARRVLDARGGLIAFDVGVGKTYTALAIIARARQEGWVRRPVILVPGSLVWKWHDDVRCTLPDYQVLVIGSKRKRLIKGDRKGLLTSETDTPQERAQKWQMLQAGQVDVVILSMDALARTKMNEAAVLQYVNQVEAVERSIALRKRAIEEAAKNPKARETMSERERALLEHGVRAWVDEILSLPNDWTYDPGISWDDIGIDMLVVDEAAAFKNLHKPQPREDGVPKFMGGGGEGSDRAWQLDFRAAAVRRTTGGAGVVLLTATPAKNSPLEFYNLIQFIDPLAFTRAGILDPEQFIDRFLRIEYREVLDSSFDIVRKMAVTGFKNLEDLRTIIFRYGEFRTGAEVGLKLPTPVVETITIKMDDVQEDKYDSYVGEIEDILANPQPGSSSNAILGLLARCSLVALHGALDEGYDYRTALTGGTVERKVETKDGPQVIRTVVPRPIYSSPKLDECARRVAASPNCGHIIFCEPTAVHLWMREVLVAQGIKRERIAILNAAETKPMDRIRIAREFNGLSSEAPPPGTCGGGSSVATTPKYDVVIANSVAYEGIDLQVRTCTIHHLDLPWTPADLEQRNGRAVRQGNTLGTVQIFYYFADGSTDGYRYSLIDGKATWLGDLLKSQVRDTNNPGAQQQMTPEDILLMISRDKDKTRALLEEKRKRAAAEAKARIAKEATRVLRQAAGRFRDARNSRDPETAARLRAEGEERLADLEQVSPDAWPWAPWMYAARDLDMLIPDVGAPVYEGLRVARPRVGAPDQTDYLEFGTTVEHDGKTKIGLRQAGSPGWTLFEYTGSLAGAPLLAEHIFREGLHSWPDDDDTRTAAALTTKIPEAFRFGDYRNLKWAGASDAFLEKWWPRFETALVDGLVADRDTEAPLDTPAGLVIATGAQLRDAKILPPTRAGWRRFLELLPKSGLKYTPLSDLAGTWWARRLPYGALDEPEPPGPPAPTPAPSPPRGGKMGDRGAGRTEAPAGPTSSPRTSPVTSSPSSSPARAGQDTAVGLSDAPDAEEPVLMCERCGHLSTTAERHNAMGALECPAGTSEFRPATPEDIRKYGRKDPGPARPGTFRYQEQQRQKLVLPGGGRRRGSCAACGQLTALKIDKPGRIVAQEHNQAGKRCRGSGEPVTSITPPMEATSAATPPTTPATDRPPRASKGELRSLVARLDLLLHAVRVGSTSFWKPNVNLSGVDNDQIEIFFRGDDATEDGAVSTLTLTAAPFQGLEQVDLRGEMRDQSDNVVASFDWVTVSRTDLTTLRETDLSRWFKVTTLPEAKLPSYLAVALDSLHLREVDEPNEAGHELDFPNDRIDGLLARGLIVASSGGYLMTEAAHARYQPAPARDPSVRYGRCKVCSAEVRVTSANTAFEHKDDHKQCPGGGQPATPLSSYGEAVENKIQQLLMKRLNIMPQGVRVGDTRFLNPQVTGEADGLVKIVFHSRPVVDELGFETIPARVLTLTADPRGADVKARGEIRNSKGAVEAAFEQRLVQQSHLVLLKERDLAEWFGIAAVPDPLTWHEFDALTALRAAEDKVDPGVEVPWDMSDHVKQKLVERGYVVPVKRRTGRAEHHRTTSKGRIALNTGMAVPPDPRYDDDVLHLDDFGRWKALVANVLVRAPLPSTVALYPTAERVASIIRRILKEHRAVAGESALERAERTARLERALVDALASDESTVAVRPELVQQVMAVHAGAPLPSPPDDLSEAFFRRWSPPAELQDTTQRYTFQAHKVLFLPEGLQLRYNDYTGRQELRINVGLPTKQGRTSVQIERGSPTTTVERSDTFELGEDQLVDFGKLIVTKLTNKARMVKVPAPQVRPKERDWADELVELVARDDLYPQLRLSRRFGSGARRFDLVDQAQHVVGAVTVGWDHDLEAIEPADGAVEARVLRALEVLEERVAEREERSEATGYDATRTEIKLDEPRADKVATGRSARYVAELAATALTRELAAMARKDLDAASRVLLAMSNSDTYTYTPSEVIDFFDANDLENAATLLRSFVRTRGASVEQLAADLATTLDRDLGVRSVSVVEGDLIRITPGMLRETKREKYIIASTGYDFEAITVTVDTESPKYTLVKPTKPRAAVKGTSLRIYGDPERTTQLLRDVWERYTSVLRQIIQAPAALEQAHQLVLAAAALVKAPKCQGPARAAAERSLADAHAAFVQARQQLLRDLPADAVEQLQQVSVAVAETARNVAQSCADGQTAINV